MKNKQKILNINYNNTKLMELKGQRLLVASATKRKTFSAEDVKRFSGGDKLTSRIPNE